MERLHKQAFCSCFGGIAMFGNFTVLLLGITPIVLSGHTYNSLRLTVFTIGCSLACIGFAFLFAGTIQLYANVIERTERVRWLVSLCRFGGAMIYYSNPIGLPARFLWKKVLRPAGLYIVGGAAVAGFMIGLWWASQTKASREEEKEDSWVDAWLG